MANLDLIQSKPSFNGFEFEFDTETRRSGKRLSVHTYPFIDEHYIEEMGKAPQEFSIRGYVAGGLVSDKYKQLDNEFEKEGAGILWLPTSRKRIEVNLSSVEWVYSASEQNKWSFVADFIRAGAKPAPFSRARSGTYQGRLPLLAELRKLEEYQGLAATFLRIKETHDAVIGLLFGSQRTRYAQDKGDLYRTMAAQEELTPTNINIVDRFDQVIEALTETYREEDRRVRVNNANSGGEYLVRPPNNSGPLTDLLEVLEAIASMPTPSQVIGSFVESSRVENEKKVILIGKCIALSQMEDVVYDLDYLGAKDLQQLKMRIALIGQSLRLCASELCAFELVDQCNGIITRMVGRLSDIADRSKGSYFARSGASSSLAAAWEFYKDPCRASEILANNSSGAVTLPSALNLLK